MRKLKIPNNKATLLFLLKDKKILLAMKKRGFGKGRWNGVGGKPNQGETIEKAATRETQEEIFVTPLKVKKVAVLNFYFSHQKEFDQQVIVYFCQKWNGSPKESEEMKPAWFLKDNLPFNKMWPDDSLWLPHVIAGKFVSASFVFGKGDLVLDYKVKIT